MICRDIIKDIINMMDCYSKENDLPHNDYEEDLVINTALAYYRDYIQKLIVSVDKK